MSSPAEPHPDLVERRRKFHRLLFDWCLVRAADCLKDNADDDAATRAANWLFVAARSADNFGCGQLASARLEALALTLAARLPPPATSRARATPGGLRWLHVMSIGYAVGGHSALLRRWVEADGSGDEHHLVLTSMSEFAVPELSAAIAQRGGRVSLLGDKPALMERARRLREIAWREADRVVLHSHMWDIVPAIAFGIPGGPPVLLLNHADHTFWVGAATADRIVNLRQSGEDLTIRYRGVERNFLLPIPLPGPGDPVRLAQQREAMRRALGIPPRALVFLTIGAAFKYCAMGALDFLAMARRLLAALPEAYLLAVGPSAHSPDWAAATQALTPRLIALGPQHPVAGYHAAADIYLEGFPFDSATALLEAAVAGLPVVCIPASAPLPFSAHHFPLSVVAQPADVADYLTQALALSASPAMRLTKAASLRGAVVGLHCGEAWRRSLAELKLAVPDEHGLYAIHPSELATELDRFWTEFLMRRHRRHPLLAVMRHAAELHLDMRVDLGLALAASAMERGVSPRRLIGFLLWLSGRQAAKALRCVAALRRQGAAWDISPPTARSR
jgi:hypothetical protein